MWQWNATARSCDSLPVCSRLQLENATKKRERATSDMRITEQKQEKKRLKGSKKAKDPAPPGEDFRPYDYSQSDFGAFAGKGGGCPGGRHMIVREGGAAAFREDSHSE